MIENKWYSQEKINELYPEAIIVPPQKIGKFPGTKGITMEDIYTGGEYFAQLKKDGYCYIYNKTENNSYLFSRTKSRTTGLPSEKGANVPHIMKALDNILPKGTIVVGEIYFHGKTSKEVTTVMGCLSAKAVSRQKENKLYYYIHDVIMYGGESWLDEKAIDRAYLLEDINALLVDASLACSDDTYDYIEIAQRVEEDLMEFTSNALANGEEGIVLKRKTDKYQPDLRPAWSTIKVKKVDTVDVICMGFEDATKEYTGKETSQYWIIEQRVRNKINTGLSPMEQLKDEDFIWVEYKRGTGNPQYIKSPNFRTIEVTKPYYNGWKTAIRIGLIKDGELVQIGTVSSGLNDELREDFAKNEQKYIGKVIECEIMEKTEGALRHPIFKKFREDKIKEECTYETVF